MTLRCLLNPWRFTSQADIWLYNVNNDRLKILTIQLGEQRGIEKGRHEGKLEVARTMLQNGLDRNTVMKMTGLSDDDLAQIRH